MSAEMCDCELSHNGFGSVGRQCDCDERKVLMGRQDAADIADLLIETTRFRMQCRVDACLERNDNDVRAASESAGIGISYGLGLDIVRALDHAEAEIARLRGEMGIA
jgi:hypothetical protein